MLSDKSWLSLISCLSVLNFRLSNLKRSAVSFYFLSFFGFLLILILTRSFSFFIIRGDKVFWSIKLAPESSWSGAPIKLLLILISGRIFYFCAASMLLSSISFKFSSSLVVYLGPYFFCDSRRLSYLGERECFRSSASSSSSLMGLLGIRRGECHEAIDFYMTELHMNISGLSCCFWFLLSCVEIWLEITRSRGAFFASLLDLCFFFILTFSSHHLNSSATFST